VYTVTACTTQWVVWFSVLAVACLFCASAFRFLGYVSSRKTEGAELPPHFLGEYGITNREHDIIRLLSRGSTTKEIGQQLFVSHRTVETHARSTYRKCDITNRVELLNLVDSCRGR
jgi:DNA-binding NarL/FixJ family response regulator